MYFLWCRSFTSSPVRWREVDTFFNILTDINFEDMNCNKSAHIQFASHLVVLNGKSYICTFLQYTADLSWIMHNQASWMR